MSENGTRHLEKGEGVTGLAQARRLFSIFEAKNTLSMSGTNWIHGKRLEITTESWVRLLMGCGSHIPLSDSFLRVTMAYDESRLPVLTSLCFVTLQVLPSRAAVCSPSCEPGLAL